jgi:signal transduction histidine kinase
MGRKRKFEIQPMPEGVLVGRDLKTRTADPSAEKIGIALRYIARLQVAGASCEALCSAVASGLAGLSPGSSVSVLSIEPIRTNVCTLATGGHAKLDVIVECIRQPGSFIVDCARRPLSVLSISDDSAKGQFRLDSGHQMDLATLLGVAVPIGASSTWVLLLALPADTPVSGAQEDLRVFGGTLRSMMRRGVVEVPTLETHDTVGRAKLEWEMTADALPQVICLLDAAGRVLRANRAVERWSLGRVEDAPGQHFHHLLHQNCSAADCHLLNGVTEAFRRMQSETRRAYEFQFQDRQLARVIKVRLGRMMGPNTSQQASAAACAVLVVQDVTEIELARRRLAALNLELETRVEDRTRELAEANRGLEDEVTRRAAIEVQLREKSGELSALSAGLMNAQEQERKRISRELHDSIGQSLGALKYGLERAAELERQGCTTGTIGALQKSIATVKETMDDVRNIALGLRPTVLDDLGAASAVKWFCRTFAASYPDLEVVVDVTAPDDEVPVRLTTTIFRSLQELLNNVTRHARARVVSVGLHLAGGQLILEVKDDGVGLKEPLPAPSGHQGQGTRNLRERAELSGGRFDLKSGSPKGAVALMRWELLAGEVGTAGAKQGKGKRA